MIYVPYSLQRLRLHVALSFFNWSRFLSIGVMIPLLFLFFFLVVSPAPVISTPLHEISSLYHLFFSTNGDQWRWRNPLLAGPMWNFTEEEVGGELVYMDDPCNAGGVNTTWQGISCSHAPHVCSHETCHITNIELGVYNLVGSIPPEVRNLSHLVHLDLFGNQINGVLPPEVCELTLLESLKLYSNDISGPIPLEISHLDRLAHLSLYTNQLSGSIPPEVGQLFSLTYLDMDVNAFTGTIPVELGQLSALVELYIGASFMTGSIPPEVGQLTALEELFLYDDFGGTIPREVGNLTSLFTLYLSRNRLTGHIPSELWSLVSLDKLFLDDNSLSGSIPIEISQLASLQLFQLYRNELTGTIPGGALSHLTRLEQLVLNRNQLTGTIPSQLGDMLSLQQIAIFRNHLSGSIPPSFGNLSALDTLALYRNMLSGTIPSTIEGLTSLQHIGIEGNRLTGTIPTEIGSLTLLDQCTMHENYLTGPIPPTIGQLSLLERLALEKNVLTGSIPGDMGNLLNLEELYVQENALRGTLPHEISNMTRLRTLFMQSNRLSGKLEGVFNHSVHTELTLIDLSDNVLTGAIPSEVFNLPELSVLSLSVNCFSEDLSVDICKARKIEVLSLNGLGAAEQCEGNVVVPFSGVSLYNAIGGTVPTCLWALGNLTVLHLTGNRLSGKLIPFLPVRSQLSSVSLSHNQLSGTIPPDVLKLASLDLSYNLFNGEYLEDVSSGSRQPDSNLSLEINRLSGRLPVVGLEEVSQNGSLSILRGNIYSCDTIPTNDDYASDYICGSKNFNDSLLLFAIAMGLLVCLGSGVLLLVFIYRKKKENLGGDVGFVDALYSKAMLLWTYATYLRQLNSNVDISLSQEVRRIILLSDSFVTTMIYAMKLTAIVVVGSAVLYLLKGLDSSDTYATHSNTYSWFWTLAYMRGVVPAAVLVSLWVLVICSCFYAVFMVSVSHRKETGDDDRTPIGHKPQGFPSKVMTNQHGGLPRREYMMRLSVSFIFNAVVMIAVNASYIYSTQQPLDASVHFAIQLSLSLFRLVYVVVALPFLSKFIKIPADNAHFRFILLTINNLIVPCVVTALTSDVCFRALLVPSDSVSTPYTYRTCDIFHFIEESGERVCDEYSVVQAESASLIPPFTYNNQCGSVLLTSYIPVFLLGYAMQLVLPPMIVLLLMRMPFSRMPLALPKVLNGIIWPEYWSHQGDDDAMALNKALLSKEPHVMLQTSTIFCNDINNNLLVMLTFGLCSPVLAAAILCALLLKMSLWVLLIGRFTSLSGAATSPQTEESGHHFAVAALAKLYIPLDSVLKRSFWRIGWCSATFVSLLSWDIVITDGMDVLAALWALFTPLAVVAVLRCVTVKLTQKTSVSTWTERESTSPLHADEL